jgi:rhodanese-related sulfurtransferase
MKKILPVAILISSLALSAFAYNTQKAQEYNKFYSHFDQKACANSKLFIKAKDVMKMIRQDKGYTLLDVRTKGEKSVIKLSDKNALDIDLKDLFEAKNLNKLPTDKKIIIVCHSGTRALMSAMALKQIGFKNVQVLTGGLIALAAANTTKNAPLK